MTEDEKGELDFLEDIESNLEDTPEFVKHKLWVKTRMVILIIVAAVQYGLFKFEIISVTLGWFLTSACWLYAGVNISYLSHMGMMKYLAPYINKNMVKKRINEIKT